jgi:hypothetical protein
MHQKAAWQYQKQGLISKNVGSVVVKPCKEPLPATLASPKEVKEFSSTSDLK